MPSYVTHFEAAIDGTELSHDRMRTLHKDRPLWVRYDLEAVREAVDPEHIAGRLPTLWRYRELLPPPEGAELVSLAEVMTPLLRAPRLASQLGLDHFWIKDESIAHTYVGDSNLDGEFNSSDFVHVFTAGKYETGQTAGWGDGDWDGNALFDSSDFVAAFTDGGYELGPPAVTAVPEPCGLVTALISLLACVACRRYF